MVKIGASGGVTATKVDPKKKTKATKSTVALSVVDAEILVEPIESVLGPEFSEGWDERADAPDLHDSGKFLFRCSMLGDCQSALVAYALEETPGEPPENIRKRMDEGSALERKIIDRALSDIGAKVVTFPQMVKLIESGVIAGYNHDVHNDGKGGQVQIRMKAKKALLFGHLDSLIIFESTGEIAFMEVKALGPDLWKSWSSNKKVEGFLAKALDGKYAWQISGQMTTGLPCILVAGQKIEDGADIGEVQWRRLDTPPYSKKEVKERIANAMVHVNAGVIPACDEGRFGCPYFGFTFHEQKKDETKWLLDGKYAELMGYVKQRATARVDKNEAEEVFKEAGENINALLDELELDRSKRYGFEDEAHNKFTVRWIDKEMPERVIPAGTQSYPDVRLVGDK